MTLSLSTFRLNLHLVWVMSYKNAFFSGYSCEFGSGKYYALCGFGGVLSCGLTHTAVVPLDLVKCRIQVDAQKYKGIVSGMKLTVAEEGTRGYFDVTLQV